MSWRPTATDKAILGLAIPALGALAIDPADEINQGSIATNAPEPPPPEEPEEPPAEESEAPPEGETEGEAAPETSDEETPEKEGE